MSTNTEKSKGTILSGFADEADKADEATAINSYIYISKDMGDSILITTPGGDVVVNTGLPGAGPKHRKRFSAVSENPIRHIILTQCHANQFGGAQAMRDPETEIIAQGRYPECRQYWKWLHEFYANRSNKLWGSVLGKDRSELKGKIEEAKLDILFDDSHCFELGGRQFELYATPGGESLDSLVIWLPQDKIAIVGNLFGPIFGHIPNLYTLRGDKIRSAIRYIESIERVKALNPVMVITGHQVIVGIEEIQGSITKLSDAVGYLHEKTIEGMNAGRDVQTLMRDITLPEHLQVGQGHGKVPWCIRAIWEEYAGWFHYDSTTSLYDVPRSSVAGDIVELAGGVDHITARAQQYISSHEPLKAIHLIDIALASEPENSAALQAKIDAHQQLLDEGGSETFSEIMWLKSEVKIAEAKLAGS
jgi:alkyl sulfatase BDS1-like metallo-beta-lactamase superfamily hydrolase